MVSVSIIIGAFAIVLSVIIGLIVGITIYVKENKRLQRDIKAKKDEIRELSKGIEDIDMLNVGLREKLEVKERCEKSLKSHIDKLEEENRYLIEHGANILNLQAKEDEYNDILDGKKKDIAVANKKYWQKRLLDSHGEFKTFHAVSVTNGHRKSEPGALFLLADIHIANHRDSGLPIFDIILGDRLN